MSQVLDLADLRHQIELPNGDRIVLLNRLIENKDRFSNTEKARNVFRIDASARVKWQVQSEFDADGDPFTNLRMENGLTAYRWDGGRYAIDLDTGVAAPLVLER